LAVSYSEIADRAFARPTLKAVGSMLPLLLCTTALWLGQTSSPPEPQPVAPSPPPDRWFVMRELQGTSIGAILYDSSVQISGWTHASFTASTDVHEQLPMGFNYRANEFLLQQNWLRLERPVNQNGTEPTFGFRSDTILPGSDYRFTVARGLFDSQLAHIEKHQAAQKKVAYENILWALINTKEFSFNK
jgi:hypothetical protein